MVVLVQSLTTSPGWLEIEHALSCERLLSDDCPEDVPDPLIKEVFETYPSLVRIPLCAGEGALGSGATDHLRCPSLVLSMETKLPSR